MALAFSAKSRIDPHQFVETTSDACFDHLWQIEKIYGYVPDAPQMKIDSLWCRKAKWEIYFKKSSGNRLFVMQENNMGGLVI